MFFIKFAQKVVESKRRVCYIYICENEIYIKFCGNFVCRRE